MKLSIISLVLAIALCLAGSSFYFSITHKGYVSENKFQQTVAELNQLKVEIENLKANLRDWQYMGIDPMISVTISDIEFKQPESYDGPKIKFKINIKQTNANFPLKKYYARIDLGVYDPSNYKVTSVDMLAEMENGVSATADEYELYGKKIYDFGGYTIKPTGVIWYPIPEHKPVN